jgi:hypothetical protein
MLRVLIYCVLFALVPVVAWLTARRVSTFERRLVAAVMVVVPTGLIVFVMVMTSHGKGATAALSAEDAPNSTASWSIGPLLELDTESTAVTPTAEASVALPPADTIEVDPLALGGRPDVKSGKQPGSTSPSTPGFAPAVPAEPVGVILPPVTISSSTVPRTVPPVTVPVISTPPRPSPPAGPSTTPPIIEPTTPVTTPPRTTPPVTTSAAPTTPPPVTTTPVTEPTSAGPTTVTDPVTSGLSDLLSASAFLSATASQSA